MTTQTYKKMTVKEFRHLTNRLVQKHVKMVREAILDEAYGDSSGEDETAESVFARFKQLDPEQQAQVFEVMTDLVNDDIGDQIAASPYADWTPLERSRLWSMMDKQLSGEGAAEPAPSSDPSKPLRVAPPKADGSDLTKKVLYKRPSKEDTLNSKQVQDFAGWLKRYYASYIPEEIKAADIKTFLVWVKTASKKGILPHGFDDMIGQWKARNYLRGVLGKTETDKGNNPLVNDELSRINLNSDEDRIKRDVASKQNDMNTLKSIAAESGTTVEAVRQAMERIMNKVREVGVVTDGPGPKANKDIEVDPVEFNSTIDMAARKYVSFIKISIEQAKKQGAGPIASDAHSENDWSAYDFFDAFNEYVLKSARVEDISDAEALFVTHLAALIEEGDEAGAVEMLKKDLVAPGKSSSPYDSGNSVITFQNYVAKLFFPETRGGGAKNKTAPAPVKPPPASTPV